MKCPACNKHELLNHAWISTGEYGEYKDDDYYDCANCGPMPKEYVNAVQARIEELEAELVRKSNTIERLCTAIFTGEEQ